VSFSNLLTRRYAAWAKLTPDTVSPRSKFPLVTAKHRAGFDYEYPVQVQNSQGFTLQGAQTGSTTLNAAISPVQALAIVTAPNVYGREVISYADYMRAMNGASQTGDAGAYFEGIDYAVNSVIEGHERLLDIAYLHGAGTGAALAADYGVAASASGTNLGTAGYKVRFTAATWSEGTWQLLKGAVVDIYASNGSTPVAVDVVCMGVTDNTVNEVEFFKSGSSATVAAGNRFVIKGALGNQLYGVGAILRNNTTLFNINAASESLWKARSFSCGGTALTSAKLMQACAQMMSAGGEHGLHGFLHPLQFQDIVAERDELVRYTDGGAKNVDIGTTTIKFTTAAGPVELIRCIVQKQGEAHFTSAEPEGCVSIGSCEPMLVGADGACEIVSKQANTTNFEVQSMSSCAPLLRKPARNLLIHTIVPAGSTNP
jgi:hypothetical protein